jgi:hypothetical protein
MRFTQLRSKRLHRLGLGCVTAAVLACQGCTARPVDVEKQSVQSETQQGNPNAPEGMNRDPGQPRP